jgi:hypothetical protein
MLPLTNLDLVFCFGPQVWKERPTTLPDASHFTIEQPSAGITCIMSDRNILALRQTDQARTDFALLESHLEIIADQLARVPTRAYLCRTIREGDASVNKKSIRVSVLTVADGQSVN